MKYASSFECVLERRRAAATPLWAVNAHMTIYFRQNKIWFGDMTIFSGVFGRTKNHCVYIIRMAGLNESKSSDTRKLRTRSNGTCTRQRKKKDANFRLKSEKNNSIKFCIENGVRWQRMVVVAAAATLFIFKLAKLIEESARKWQHVEYIASLKCAATSITKYIYTHTHTRAHWGSYWWGTKKKKEKQVQQQQQNEAHEWKKNGYSLFCVFWIRKSRRFMA